MSEQVSSPRRPVAVGLAAGLLVVMALGGLAYAVGGLLATDGTVERFRSATVDVPDRGAVDGVVTLVRVSAVLATVLAVTVGALLVVLAVGLLVGRPVARVTAWVVCGLGLLAGCGALAAVVGQRVVPFELDAAERTTAEILTALTGAYPSWWNSLNAVLSVGQVLGYLVVAILLALPTAHPHFRRHPLVGPSAPHPGP